MSEEEVRKYYNLFKQDPNSLKIAVIGKGVVGKSSLTFRYLKKEMSGKHNPTIEDRYRTEFAANGQTYKIEILDTAGEEDYQNLLDMWISFGQGFLLVFAINDKESFEWAKEKRQRIIKGKLGQPCPLILVGNKKDLKDERVVSEEEAKNLANSWQVEYMETSALENDNCKEAFEKIATLILKSKPSNQHSGTCCNIF